jgi:hypothetical protein
MKMPFQIPLEVTIFCYCSRQCQNYHGLFLYLYSGTLYDTSSWVKRYANNTAQ